MPDMIKLATEIVRKIRELESARDELARLAQDVGPTEGAYRKELAVTTMKLKNGIKFTIDDTVVENPPATTTITIAHGICSANKVKALSSEIQWRSQMKICDMLQSELNGLQSVNKHLSDV